MSMKSGGVATLQYLPYFGVINFIHVKHSVSFYLKNNIIHQCQYFFLTNITDSWQYTMILAFKLCFSIIKFGILIHKHVNFRYFFRRKIIIWIWIKSWRKYLKSSLKLTYQIIFHNNNGYREWHISNPHDARSR